MTNHRCFWTRQEDRDRGKNSKFLFFSSAVGLSEFQIYICSYQVPIFFIYFFLSLWLLKGPTFVKAEDSSTDKP